MKEKRFISAGTSRRRPRSAAGACSRAENSFGASVEFRALERIQKGLGPGPARAAEQGINGERHSAGTRPTVCQRRGATERKR